MGEARWLTEEDVVAAVGLEEATAAVRGALLLEHEGRARTLPKTAVAWAGGSTLHALGGVAEGLGVVGAKVWAHTPGGANPTVVLWDDASGELLAVIEAFALGQLRTASISAVAIAELSAADATVMAIIGTGKQAAAQVAAALSARPITCVRAFSPTHDHRVEFGRRLVQLLGSDVRVHVCDSAAEAVASAHIVTTATRAREPFLDPSMLGTEVLVNALGAITPERAELTGAVAADAAIVVSDSPQAAAELSAELAAATSVVALSAVVAGEHPGTLDGRRVFKAMGLGLADVAVAAEVLRRSTAAGRGRPIPARTKATPRLFPPRGT